MKKYEPSPGLKSMYSPSLPMLQLEPDQEQQQYDAKLGKLHGRLHVADHAQTPRSDQHSRTEIAEDRTEFEALKKGHQQYRSEEKDSCLFEKVHGGTRMTTNPRIMRERARARNRLPVGQHGAHQPRGIPTTAVSMPIEPISTPSTAKLSSSSSRCRAAMYRSGR